MHPVAPMCSKGPHSVGARQGLGLPGITIWTERADVPAAILTCFPAAAIGWAMDSCIDRTHPDALGMALATRRPRLAFSILRPRRQYASADYQSRLRN
jgi:hypothetical protein